MPSSITLTVSHLPTSTSFFLSALQPLNYTYRGSAGKTIGFGLKNSSGPADFWITQEIAGVPAGAAHVAFTAESRAAVHEFFAAALNAGGTVHGEPCLRDASGYYSAAVIDFDGNSIEAVYRPADNAQSSQDTMTVVSRRTSAKAPTLVSRAPSSVSKAPSVAMSKAPSVAVSKAPSVAVSKAPSVAVSRAPSIAASRAPPTSAQPSPPKGDTLDRILDSARNTADVARSLIEHVRPQPSSTNPTPAGGAQSQSTEASDAIVGTLLGVAAGAALHYVFSNRKSSPDYTEEEPAPPRRLSLGSAAHTPTAPVARYDFAGESDSKSLYSRGGGKYITMQDNDYASTVASDVSRKSRKMLTGPPSSYRPPTVITQAQTQTTRMSRRSRSVSRAPAPSESPEQIALSTTSRRRSSSVGRSTSGRSLMRELQRSETFPAPKPPSLVSASARSEASTVRAIKVAGSATSKVAASTTSKAAGSTTSKVAGSTTSKVAGSTTSKVAGSTTSKVAGSSTSKVAGSTASKASRSNRPAPPSRAATWADGSASTGAGAGRARSDASFATARSGAKTVLGLEKVTSEASQTQRNLTGSVVGKLKDVKRLDFGGLGGEITPADSVSQVSSSRGSRRSSRR
ncbi:hypothetical protein DV738_g854, partial [Chaetothyriales sp. CBS 135597]